MIKAAGRNSSWATVMHVQYLCSNVHRGHTRNYHRFVVSKFPAMLIPSHPPDGPRPALLGTLGLPLENQRPFDLNYFDDTIRPLSLCIGLIYRRNDPLSSDCFILDHAPRRQAGRWL